jgi:hypothetical protein
LVVSTERYFLELWSVLIAFRRRRRWARFKWRFLRGLARLNRIFGVRKQRFTRIRVKLFIFE